MSRTPPRGEKVYCRVTRRVRLLPVSAMYRLLAVLPAVTGNTATPHGTERAALVAGPLSPSVEPPPATRGDFLGAGCHLADSADAAVGGEDIP